MKEIKTKIERLLKYLPELRDNDSLLQMIYWVLYDKASVNFHTNLTNPESIRRMRAKLQELDETLRGKAYIPRKEKAEEIRTEFRRFY